MFVYCANFESNSLEFHFRPVKFWGYSNNSLAITPARREDIEVFSQICGSKILANWDQLPAPPSSPHIRHTHNLPWFCVFYGGVLDLTLKKFRMELQGWLGGEVRVQWPVKMKTSSYTHSTSSTYLPTRSDQLATFFWLMDLIFPYNLSFMYWYACSSKL